MGLKLIVSYIQIEMEENKRKQKQTRKCMCVAIHKVVFIATTLLLNGIIYADKKKNLALSKIWRVEKAFLA